MIVGTAGHVDHGKTSLVKALTGIDTDRLPEEKRRGITLELGFAHLDLPDGRRLGVVDVPGHERFVKAMTAGAGGIDLALLVVAADEGVMPQTREHVDICALLGVRRGVLVVTKADLLPGLGDGWLELLEAELRGLVAGTFLEGAALVPVSAKTGDGLGALKAELGRLAATLSTEPSARSSDGPLFLPIDRAFTIKGFGCVVTGTLWSGRLAVADEVALLPGLEGPVRLRGLQQHGKPVERAQAGERVAVNVMGVEMQDVTRGMALVRKGELSPARVLDVELTLLPSLEAPLPRRTRQLITVGTEQVEAVVRLLDVDALRPGETCFAQLRLAHLVAAMPQLRFVVRGTRAVAGRGATVGGGRVLALDAPRRRAGASKVLAELAGADLPQRLLWLTTQAGYVGLTERELFARASASQKELARALEASAARGQVVLVDKEARRFVSGAVLTALQQRTRATLDRFHAEHPEADGLPKEELRQRLGVPHERTLARVLAPLVEAKTLEVDKELLRLPGRGRAFTEATNALRAELVTVLEAAQLQPPLLADLAAKVKTPAPRVTELLATLAAEGLVVRAGELHFAASAIAMLEAKLVAFLTEKGRITTQEFKDLSGLSRKFLIPLAELFDARKVTLRVGDVRTLRSRAP
ncbi:MAG: selenocysteine-specific translation elongation factor [Myxococcaceae bacterium]|nr:selenocysteine-specific translation elongation factor [Myxococcaceae bacterium]